VTRASIHLTTPVTVLVPLNDVKYEGDFEMVACPPHHKRACWRMDFVEEAIQIYQFYFL